MTVPTRPRVLDRVVADGARRRRRPLGGTVLARPIYTSGRVYLTLTVGVLAAWLAVLVVPGLVDAVEAADRAVLDVLAATRVDLLVRVSSDLQVLAADWPSSVLRWATVAVGLAARRFRHVIVLAAILLAVTAATTVAVESIGRPPVTGVEVIGTPEPLTHPSRPVVALGLTLVGAMYVLAPRGRVRNRAKAVAAAVMVAFVASRLYLALDHPTDVLVGLVLGMAVPVVAFRYLVPDASFPIVYRRRGPARLAAAQVEAIEGAVSRQLGWRVEAVRELRPPGSAGSTPLLLDLDPATGGAPAQAFAKLYSLTHLRSDRWYKLARAIRYGRLEDEAPFGSVRQLVEHEDYLLRVAAAEGLPVPRTHGVLELQRGRDYLLVMESLPDARQLGDVTATPELIDQGLDIVAGLWVAGVAHRDVKPANLVVSGGVLHLVDLSFGEVAPSPWRQAVDLADMMLCLGLSAGPELVYARAQARFAPAEVAEAFASTCPVTIPAQLRRLLQERAPDLVEQFRALAPAHRPIAIQRWDLSRAALTAGVVAAAVAAVALLAFNLGTVGLL